MASEMRVNESIEALSQQFAENFNNGDFAALADLFSEDASLLPPGARLINGRDNIRNYFRQARRMQSLSLEPSSIKALGNAAAREMGVMLIGVRRPRQQAAREVRGKYVLLWQLDNGQWQIESCIWNRSVARRPGGQRRQAAGQQTGGGRVNRANRAGGGGQNRGGGGQNRGGGGQNRGGGGQNRGGGQNGGGQQRAPFVSRVG